MKQQPATLPRRVRGAEPRAFDRLRQQGLRRLQQLAGERWTDHNLHDPGITLLEQLCVALADIEYRADFPVADHLAGADGRIDHDALSLHPPAAVFPCRATTAQDYRRLLLDAVPGLDDAALEPVPAEAEVDGGARIAGIYLLRLNLAAGHAGSAAQRIAAARAAYRGERNLCEDLADAVQLVREVPLEMHGRIELDGPRDAVEVLAEIYDRCARFVARAPQGVGLEQALRDGMTQEEFFTGPRMRRGRRIQERQEGGDGDELFLSDLSTRVQAIDGVARVHLEALRSPGAAAGAISLPWSGPGWTLRLRVPDDPEEVALLEVARAGGRVAIDMRALRQRCADLRAGDLEPDRRADGGPAGVAAALLPRGVHRAPTGCRSVQHDFPAAYGLGRNGLPASVAPGERLRVQQFKAWLRLFDQEIADAIAQIDHLAELFSLDGGSMRSYWHQDVDAGGASFDGLGAAVLDDVHRPFDARAERKSRALDHLLALHGVTLSQDGMRQFAAHLDAAEQDAWLLANKAGYLRDVVTMGRDRAGGFDPARPAWQAPDNCAGLLRAACRLLGFRHAQARPLARVLARRRLALVDAAGEAAPAGALARVDRPAAPATPAQWRADVRGLLLLRAGALAGAFLRAGLRRDCYASTGDDTCADASPRRLFVGPDEDGGWWPLGEFVDAAHAARAADSARRFLRQLNDDSEGLHVVEHVLLRPAGADADAPPADFFALRLTVVLPAWTVRTHDAGFRRFAHDVLRAECPAHLGLACLWLEFDEMVRFEADLERWLDLKRAYCRALDEDAAVLRALAPELDAAAAALVRRFVPAWQAGAGGGHHA